jgi:hypothetical protein
VDLKEVLLGEVEVKYKSDVSIVRKLAMFGNRIIRSKAKQVEEEFTKNLEKSFEMQFNSNHHPSWIYRPIFFHRQVPRLPLERVFDIHSLASEVLMKLYHEANSLITEIRIETVPGPRGHKMREQSPASTIGLPFGIPTIQFADSLSRKKRIEAIAHELVHLLLVYRHGLGVIGRKIPCYGNSDDVFRYFMSMGGDWEYLLGQIGNTVHHLILIDYLKGKYGIDSRLHLYLLNHNFSILLKDSPPDKESQHATGIIAFEYEKLIGNVDRLINFDHQPEFFRKSYQSAQKHFGIYGSQTIPTPSSYREDILSFLEDLGYQKQDFLFFPDSSM